MSDAIEEGPPEENTVERQSGPPVTQSTNSGPMNVLAVSLIPPTIPPFYPKKVEVELEEREDETVLFFKFSEELKDL